jgi:DNA replication protein DnaC/primosomal protein DnaI
MAMNPPKTYVSLEELYDMYLSSGDQPPAWLSRLLGKPVKAVQPQEYLDRLVAKSGIPSLFSAAEPSYDMLDALADGGGIYICGVQGAGKTWMACRIAKGWLYRGLGDARFVSSVKLLSEIGSTYGGNGSEENVLAKYSLCDLLVVDDLGKEVSSQWSLSKLFDIFDSRYANKRPTIVTTQFDTSSLAKRMSKGGDPETAMAIVSRFREKYWGVNLGNMDRRAV